MKKGLVVLGIVAIGSMSTAVYRLYKRVERLKDTDALKDEVNILKTRISVCDTKIEKLTRQYFNQDKEMDLYRKWVK